MLHDIFQSVMPAGASFFANAKTTCFKIYVIGDDQQILFGIRFIKMHDLLNRLSAQVHIGQRLDENDLPVADPALSDHGFAEPLGSSDMVAVHQFVDHFKTCVMPRTVVFSARISQADNNKKCVHTCLPFTVHTARRSGSRNCSDAGNVFFPAVREKRERP